MQTHSLAFYSRSVDRKLRIKSAQLAELTLVHVTTFLDSDVLADAGSFTQFAGGTEWQTSISGQPISLGWDWALGQDGSPYLLTAVSPRSNLCLLDEKGYDQSEPDLSSRLIAFISSRFWHSEVKAVCGTPSWLN